MADDRLRDGRARSSEPAGLDPIRSVPPAWVFFDVGETLIRPHPSFAGAIVDICADEGVALSRDDAHFVADARIRMFLDLVKEHEGGTFSTDTGRSKRFWVSFYKGFMVELGMGDADASRLAEVIYGEMTQARRYRVFDDVPAVLEILAAAGIRMAVVSNYEAFLDEMLDSLGIGHHLEVRAISGIEGIEKPDPEIYRRALARAGVAPADVVHVGDDPRADAQPASDLGMGAIVIDRRDRHPGNGWPTIATMEELPRMIGLL